MVAVLRAAGRDPGRNVAAWPGFADDFRLSASGLHQLRTRPPASGLRDLDGAQELTQWDSWATRVPNGAALIDEVHRLDDELVTDFREAAGTGRFAATRVFGTARQPFDPSLIERRDHELRLDVDVIRPPDGHNISGVRIRILYFSLAQVVGWIRGHDSGIAVRQIRSALESRCVSGQIRARGQRRIYLTDRALPLHPTDPAFVWFSDENSELHPSFEPISADEWKDLTFFARPDHVPGEQYHEALARALDELRSQVELRSKSRSRPAWTGVEFSRDDVMRVWPRAGRAALPAETTLRAELRTDPTRGAPAEPEAGTVSNYRISPGPKGGKTRLTALAWKAAERILNSEKKPKRGHGRLAELARQVNEELKGEGYELQDDTVRRTIGPSLREWENKDPEN